MAASPLNFVLLGCLLSVGDPLQGSLPELLTGLAYTHPDQQRLPLLDRLPPPERLIVRRVPNPHDPEQIDRVVTRRYPGLELIIYEAGPARRELPLRLRVTAPRYRTAEGLRVGSSLAEVRAIMGAPAYREGPELVYVLGEPTPDLLRVRVERGRVTALTWDFYID